MLFCNEHSWQWLAFISFLIFTAGGGAASIYSAFFQNANRSISFHSTDNKDVNGSAIENIANIPNVLGNEERVNGLYLEGQRNNVLEENCIENIVTKNQGIAKLSSSVVAPDFQQVTVSIEPTRIIRLEFDGYPVLNRQDYTFSYVFFSDDPAGEMDILITLQSDNSEVSSKYDMNSSTPFQNIKSRNIKTYRPQISYFFPDVPRFLKGIVKITNTSNKPFNISFVLPVIEEGLFASSPIKCSSKREGEFLSYPSLGNMPRDLNDGGTISFFFSPSWNASSLTPGVSPHLLTWTDESGANGIKLISDSNDHGKIKAVLLKDNRITMLSSDVTPLKGEKYSVDFRFKQNRADLIINGKNTTSSDHIDLPKASTFNDKFYIGCNPSNEQEAAFSTLRDFRIYKRWLNDEEINTSIKKLISKQR